ncbi:ABC transporter substrate-binding protein [Bradyrhizobium sp. JYMT SZCCT0180]|uniref:ABC transporter substrate-binding protein n=1 Tax=Bradyrhizobium sp. JYMT SZCCT0180 TaxID=2807666 RepID=UPI001BAB1D78|nr:ABC transporter substrate-binding protein [Bradyrhizobium sp. JYMT SZCCT0180]MBR1214198.1 ABC transporter substrate-binding protein [Bradyrhizobium sp. JYMT SZCCT0180]
MGVQLRFGAAILAAALVGAGASPALAQKSADTLRITMRDALPNVDPYYNNLRTGVVMHHQAWDGLVYRNPETFKNEPLLATEWKLPDTTTIEFTLRPGVKFHDGSAFTADDVVYTLNLVSDPGSKVSTPANYNWIEKAEKTGDLSVRVKLKRPTPAALDYFAMVVPIYPKAYREKVGAEGYAKAPVGAGPYKITKVEAGASIDFERFEDYWAGSPKGKPAIKKMSVRFVPDATTEMTELLASRADWIWNMNPDQFENVNKLPHIAAVRKESMRVGYLSLDAAGRTGADNPITKLKVRQAIWHAIDRQAMADKLVTGGSRVPAAPCFPTQFGCNGEAATLYDYNPAKAKQLLAEAGYPDGFDLEVASYVLPQWGSAVQNYLIAVGIRAKLNQLQTAALIQKAKAGELRTYIGSWGSYSINDVSAFMPNFLDGGADDYARDPDVQKWLIEGGSSIDTEVRNKAYSAVIQRVTQQAYFAPLHTYVTTYGYSRQLDFTPYSDELPRFYLTKWK